jgi:hypothetical protein
MRLSDILSIGGEQRNGHVTSNTSAKARTPPTAACKGGSTADASFVTPSTSLRAFFAVRKCSLRFDCSSLFEVLSTAVSDCKMNYRDNLVFCTHKKSRLAERRCETAVFQMEGEMTTWEPETSSLSFQTSFSSLNFLRNNKRSSSGTCNLTY